jgi:hypothetical protein
MQLFISDPKDKQPSVSLTLLMVSFLAILVGAGLHMYGKVEDTSVLAELFYTTSALYFGRRFNFNNKTFSSEKTEGSKE